MHLVIANVRLHHHAAGTEFIEEKGHDRAQHVTGEVANRLGARPDEKVHTEITGLHCIEFAEQVMPGVVALHNEGRRPPVKAHEGTHVTAAHGVGVEVAGRLQGHVLHVPVVGVIHLVPGVDHRNVLDEAQRTQGEMRVKQRLWLAQRNGFSWHGRVLPERHAGGRRRTSRGR